MRIGGEAPRGGPILNRGAKAIVQRRVSAASVRRLRFKRRGDARAAATQLWLRRRAKQQTRLGLAGRREPPQHDEELARQRNDHRLARSAPRVRRSPPIPRAQRAAFLVDEMTPGEFDHPPAHAGVACLGEAPLTSSLAALVRRSCQAGIARQGSPIPDLAGEYLLHEHVRGLDSDADHPRQQTGFRVAALVWRFRQTLGARLLDLLDLLLDEAQAVQVAPHLRTSSPSISTSPRLTPMR
jgi:hypothetical protein